MTDPAIRVHVLLEKDRTNYTMRYLDPITNRHVRRTTGTANRKEAERAAARWEAELRQGTYIAPHRMAWDTFVELHEDQVQSGLADATARMFGTVFGAVERIIRPRRLADLTGPAIARFASELRKPESRGEGKPARTRSAETVRSYLKHLRWALGQHDHPADRQAGQRGCLHAPQNGGRQVRVGP